MIKTAFLKGAKIGAKNMKGFRLLQELDQESKSRKYPSYKTSTANGLTKAIIQWLTLNGCWATRVSSAGRYLPGAGKFIPSTTKRGTADIHAVIGGRHASIEVKVGRDRMSKDQVKTSLEIERSGGLYFIAKDLEGFIEWFNTIK